MEKDENKEKDVANVPIFKNISQNGDCHSLRGFVCIYDSAALGLNPEHTIYYFFNFYYWNCNEKRTKINKKRLEMAHLKKNISQKNQNFDDGLRSSGINCLVLNNSAYFI